MRAVGVRHQSLEMNLNKVRHAKMIRIEDAEIQIKVDTSNDPLTICGRRQAFAQQVNDQTVGQDAVDLDFVKDSLDIYRQLVLSTNFVQKETNTELMKQNVL